MDILNITTKEVAIIVAHPDDETLWVGGTILSHPAWNCFVVSVCRGSDTNRSPKFYRALKTLNSSGAMGDLDDGPNQSPLDEKELEQTILTLLPFKHYDLIITHNPNGEYTRHLRHEEVSKAVISLWHDNRIIADELRTFAYEDGEREYYPRSIMDATIYYPLSKEIWLRKYNVLRDIYGFDINSWELQTTPHDEAFWQFSNSLNAMNWLKKGGINR